MGVKIHHPVAPIGELMNYFHFEFNYDGSIVNIVSDNDATHKASADLSAASNKAKEALNNLNIENLHAYAWPDGSLYRFVRTEMEENELWKAVNQALPEGVRISRIYSASADDDPHKMNCKTLEEYFNINEEKLG